MAGTAEVRPIFAIFEGGGAKGLTHIGALKAMENAALEPVGVAGASAGAIVAALVAVGLRADQIFNPDGGDIFQANGASPTDLLGSDDWQAFGRFRAALAGGVPGGWFGRAGLGWRLWRMIRGGGIFARFEDAIGLFDSAAARDLLNGILRGQLATAYAAKGEPLPELVRFRHLDPQIINRFIYLKIVATDLTTRSLVLFDESTPDVVVADAVVASFSIPFFFRPAAVRGNPHGEERRFADGGLVSNLPLWVFNDEKRAIERQRGNHPPLPLVALTLDDPPVTAVPPSGFVGRFLSLATNVVRSGIFGSQTVSRGLVPDRFVVSMCSPLAVLGFDMDRRTAMVGYRAGLTAATQTLQIDLRNRPDAARMALLDLLGEAQAHSAARRTALGRPLLPQLRVSIVVPFGRGFHVAVAAGMDDDADDRLVLDRNAPGAPAAYRARDLIYVDLTRLPPAERLMTKYEMALVRPGLRGVLAVPIFDSVTAWQAPAAERAPPAAVVCLDSDADLETEYGDTEFITWLVKASVDLASVARHLGGTE